jgi:hypothetical protein
MLIWFEIKKYLSAYKRLLFGLLSAVAACVILLSGVNGLLTRGRLFEPFSIGVVDREGTGEIRFVFDFFNDIVQMDYMDEYEAEAKLKAGAIPAYVELPERFAADIIRGKNTPFTLHGSGDFPLQLAMTKLLATGGVAFLSSSQAGIYATMDYAYEKGMGWEFANRYILYPVNVAFLKQLLNYAELFSAQTVTMTDGRTAAAHYALTFLAFLCMLALPAFAPALMGYNTGVYARYRMAGKHFLHLQCIRLAGVCAVHALWVTPAYAAVAYYTLPAGADMPGICMAGLTLSICVGAFGLMAAALFKDETAFGLFIFVVAFGMLFIAGGLLPPAFLPPALHPLKLASIPHWAAEENAGMLLTISCVCFGVVCVAEFLRIRFPRAL